MAGSENYSMARELFELTRPKEYVTYLSNINNGDRTGIAAFKETVFSNDYDVDTSYLHPKGQCTNNYHVYDMFGRLATMDGVETKKCMIREIESQQKFYQAKGNVVLSMLPLTLEDWIARHKHKRICADELCIFVLNVLFNRDTVIFTASKPWSTLDPTGHEHHRNFLSLCDFHLLNLGDNMFINLIPHEEERVFSTLPPGTMMSIFQTETPSETQFEFHYKIAPPVPNSEHIDASDKEDCEVIDYFPYCTAQTNPRNKQLVDVIDSYLTPYIKRLSQEQDVLKLRINWMTEINLQCLHAMVSHQTFSVITIYYQTTH